MKLALDHHYSPVIAERLRSKGHDVVAAIEQGWDREDDEPLLALCEQEHRALLTNNVSDFTVIARRWAAQSRSHYGLIFTSDRSLPRARATIGQYVKLLDAFLADYPAIDGFSDRILWL